MVVVVTFIVTAVLHAVRNVDDAAAPSVLAVVFATAATPVGVVTVAAFAAAGAIDYSAAGATFAIPSGLLHLVLLCVRSSSRPVLLVETEAR